MGPAQYVEARQYFFQKTTLSVKEIAHILQKKSQKVIRDAFQTELQRIVPKLGIQLSLTLGPLDCVQLSLDGASATPGICICI